MKNLQEIFFENVHTTASHVIITTMELENEEHQLINISIAVLVENPRSEWKVYSSHNPKLTVENYLQYTRCTSFL